MNVFVRPARRDDCINFIDIHCPELRGHPRNEKLAKCGWWGDEEACVFLLRLYRGLGGEVFVAELNNEVVGEVEVLPHDDCLLGPRAYVNVLWVREDVRGKGVGRELINAACEWARSKGYGRLDVIPEEWSAAFYERLGFKQVATQCKAEKRFRGRPSGGAGFEDLTEAVYVYNPPIGKVLIAGTYRPGLFSWFTAWLDTFVRRHPPTAYRVKHPAVSEGSCVVLMDWLSRRGASLIIFAQDRLSSDELKSLLKIVDQVAPGLGAEYVFIQTWSDYSGALIDAGYRVLRSDVPWLSLRV